MANLIQIRYHLIPKSDLVLMKYDMEKGPKTFPACVHCSWKVVSGKTLGRIWGGGGGGGGGGVMINSLPSL